MPRFVAHAVASPHASPPGLPPFTRSLLTWSFAVALVPPLILLYAVATRSLVALDYAHVIAGGTWTGFDVYMGVVMTRIMRSLEPPARVEVAKRLTPTTFFILPSLAAVAITSGIYLAQATGRWDLHSPWIVAAGAVVLILTAQGFGIFMPNGVRIFIELAKPKPDVPLIGRLTMRNVRLAGVQAVLQVALIVIMANLRML